MSNSASVTVHIWDAEPIRVSPLRDDDPDGMMHVSLGVGSPSLVIKPHAAAELSRQLTAHMVSIARRENLAEARRIAEGGA